MIWSRSMPRVLRVALLILALAATLGVATAAASPAHIHADGPGRGCDICFTAHVVSYEPAFEIAVPVAPQMEQAVAVSSEIAAGYHLLYSYCPLTRGPPPAL